MEPKNVPNLNVAIKKSRGRQKIDMKKISNKQDLQVTFSKRRTGIFKKASELSTLCGVDIAVIMFSPNNRVFSFGSPNVDSVVQRYTGWVPTLPRNFDLNKADTTVDERELHALFTSLSNQIVADKKREENLDRLMKTKENQLWWANPIESMNKDQLNKYKQILEDLNTHIKEKHEKILSESIFTHNSPRFFASKSSSSGVNDPMTMRSASLMQNHAGVTNGSDMCHHIFNNVNSQGHKDGTTFDFF